MNTYVIRRRSNWRDAQELEAAAGRSTKVGNEQMAGEVRWIRSYVVQEDDGRLGTVCIYQAINPEAVRDHARRAGMQADEITPVVDTVIVRDDPQPAAAAG